MIHKWVWCVVLLCFSSDLLAQQVPARRKSRKHSLAKLEIKIPQKISHPYYKVCSTNDMDGLELILHDTDRLFINGADTLGQTALHIACQFGAHECVQKLLDAGAYIDSQESCGRTPLLYAAAYNHAACVKLLLARNADPNKTDRYQYAPLHAACYRGNAASVEYLVKCGADPNIVDNEGKTPLNYAAADCHMECACVLLGSGAKVHKAFPDGRLPSVVRICCLLLGIAHQNYEKSH